MTRNVDFCSNSDSLANGFDFTQHMKMLCCDIVSRFPVMGHIQMDRVAVSFSQTRKRVRHGYWASLTPMRFANGSLTENRNGRRFTVQRLFARDGREMLYILCFYLPRFLQLDFQSKLDTIFHELWHISPHFNGDIRRFAGRCFAHSHSEKKYDATVGELARQWLALDPPPELYTFLKMSHGRLCRKYGHVFGTKIPHPKLLPLSTSGLSDNKQVAC